jgi:protein tyrosine phosphatase (PTP) superfamily phosphohydrolase (DUF442 family)
VSKSYGVSIPGPGPRRPAGTGGNVPSKRADRRAATKGGMAETFAVTERQFEANRVERFAAGMNGRRDRALGHRTGGSDFLSSCATSSPR